MYAHDQSTPESLHETYKVYHHVCDRKSRRITKGPGGLYTHHRGLFIGWNRLTFDGKEYDFWHMKNTFQVHMKTLELTAGPVLARHKALIHWIDSHGRPLIAEERTITVFNLPTPAVALIDFSTRLEAISGEVFLNGDPEHGGMQFRPHNGVAEGEAGAKAVYIFHREGIDAHKEKNLPWVAETYGLHGGAYTVQHMNHPDNPDDGVYSAYRDYGRFGAFFTETIESGKSLPLRYRIFVAEGGEMIREKMQERYNSFTAAPTGKEPHE